MIKNGLASRPDKLGLGFHNSNKMHTEEALIIKFHSETA